VNIGIDIACVQSLRADGISTVELDFICTSKSQDRAFGLFDVEVNVPVRISGSSDWNERRNVTWHFRKACVSESGQ
jgi:hypothetical protein